MKTWVLLLFFCFLVSSRAFAEEKVDSFIIGATATVQINFSDKNLTHFRASLSVGAMKFINYTFTPATNFGIAYSNGGIGSELNYRNFRHTVDYILSIGLFTNLNLRGRFREEHLLGPGHVHLFSPIFPTSVRTPYRQSFNVGSTFILNNNNNQIQQLGILSMNYDRFHFGYYNDGPPFKFLGDRYDRYWTGGGFIQFYSRFGHDPRWHEWTWHFDKYTGYEKDAFEVARMLYFDSVYYNNIQKVFANRSIHNFRLSTPSGFAFNVMLSDFRKLDIQDWIHLNKLDAYHLPFLKPHVYFGVTFGNYQQIIADE